MTMTTRPLFKALTPLLLLAALLLESTWARPVVRNIRSLHGTCVVLISVL